MTQIRKTTSQTDIGAAWMRRRAAGVTLVELLLYIAILSLISLGIMQMVLEVQRSNIEFLGYADQLAESDLALRRVQVKLGDSDDVEVDNMSSGDHSCLRLKSYEQYSRSGFRFDGRNQYLRTSTTPGDHVEIDMVDQRTISVWVRVDPDHVGVGSVVMWGKNERHEFGIAIENGMPFLHLKCARLRPTAPLDIRDGNWHHLAVTFAAQAGSGVGVTPQTTKLYVDGVSLATEFHDCRGSTNSLIITARTALYIGRANGDRQSGFKGLVSDLRIWQRSLVSSEIRDLAGREPRADANIAGLYASLPLDGLPGGKVENKGLWSAGGTARRFNISASGPVVKTLVDATTYNSFCFLDADGDRLYELVGIGNVKDLAGPAPGNSGATEHTGLAEQVRGYFRSGAARVLQGHWPRSGVGCRQLRDREEHT